MTSLTPDRDVKSKAVRILAKSLYRDLQVQGFDHKQIVALATQLISEVTTSMAQAEPAAPAPIATPVISPAAPPVIAPTAPTAR